LLQQQMLKKYEALGVDLVFKKFNFSSRQKKRAGKKQILNVHTSSM
jgi:hypothetical protein